MTMYLQMVFLPEACDFIGESRQQTMSQAEGLDGTFVEQCCYAARQHAMWVNIGSFHQKVCH